MTVSVAAAGVAGAATTRHIEVCKAGSVAGTFDFTVNGGAAFGLQTGGCKTVAATAETNTVTELADSTGATHLASISLVPNTGTTSVSTRTAKVIKNKQPYQEPDSASYQLRLQKSALSKLQRQAIALGYTLLPTAPVPA